MKKTILIADDSPTQLKMVSVELEKLGYQTVTAADGEDALKKAHRFQPNLAILDVIMPKANGYQVVRQLKTSPATSAIKVLLISTKNQESDRFWGIKQGADAYLVKPFDAPTLLAAIANLI